MSLDRSLDRVWVVIDEFGLDFEVEKHILYLLRNAEKDRVLRYRYQYRYLVNWR